MATLLYCERGACGPAGACFCCSSAFFSVSSTPPEVGGATGVAPPGWVCEAGDCVLMIDEGVRFKPASHDSSRLVRKKPTARIAVVRVKRLAVPRLDMKPAPPP